MKQCDSPHLESILIHAGAKLQSQSHDSTCPLLLWGLLSDDRFIFVNMARLSSSLSPYCLGNIYTMPYDSTTYSSVLLSNSSCSLKGIDQKSVKQNLKFDIFYGTKCNARTWVGMFFVSIRLGSPGWGRDGTSVKFNRPLDLNGFMTIALILHDWMKTYWFRWINTSAD